METRARESEKQRWDRNFTDLLGELRITQNGMHIMFAFLLVLPFGTRFGAVTAAERPSTVRARSSWAMATVDQGQAMSV
ncbi:DUF6328 family protein [Catenuloplanes indicus]|uniref:Uncharacterized protein n=1 Tax=Catenuloplanes indicus TaxID=137267 RepID=A0AAE4AWK3_9ACTN|nr:DUF6328 family protein [Catenuloplanes indicus]MDQ0365117.1 hypothetical protein [Catenuloplanes indicus]